MMHGFLKLQRSHDTLELLKYGPGFLLLTAIALRARRTDRLQLDNVAIGEALLGDYRNYGLTERQYRTAKRKLSAWGLARFRSTRRGTIATILDTRIYDINAAPEELPYGFQPVREDPPAQAPPPAAPQPPPDTTGSSGPDAPEDMAAYRKRLLKKRLAYQRQLAADRSRRPRTGDIDPYPGHDAGNW